MDKFARNVTVADLTQKLCRKRQHQLNLKRHCKGHNNCCIISVKLHLAFQSSALLARDHRAYVSKTFEDTSRPRRPATPGLCLLYFRLHMSTYTSCKFLAVFNIFLQPRSCSAHMAGIISVHVTLLVAIYTHVSLKALCHWLQVAFLCKSSPMVKCTQLATSFALIIQQCHMSIQLYTRSFQFPCKGVIMEQLRVKTSRH